MIMAKKQENKTNAMRILERMDIAFESMDYECDEFTDGLEVANKLGLDQEEVFKTLVTVGSDGQHYVFVIPVAEELDFKKCARAVGVKSIQMIHVKELFDLTGYVRGGCTSIGMKKQFVTRVDETAQLFEKIYVSAGRIGTQIRLDPEDLLKAAQAEYADLTKE